MSRAFLCMSMSLDGFIAGPDDAEEHGLGIGGERLHDWGSDEGPGQLVADELRATGAVLAGRRTVELVDYWGGDHHGGVPIFVPTHRAPEVRPPGDVRFVTDGIASCVARAKAAAAGWDVMVHGAYTARECLRAGVLDALELQVVPVLLGRGRLLFDELGGDGVELDLVRTMESPNALYLSYEVVRP